MNTNNNDIDALLAYLKLSQPDPRWAHSLTALVAERDKLKQRVEELERDVDMWREDAHKWKEMYNRHYESERIWISRCDELKQRVAELEAREAELLDSNAELHRRLNRIMASPIPFSPASDLRERLMCAALTGILSNSDFNLGEEESGSWVVRYADATLAAMRKGESNGK